MKISNHKQLLLAAIVITSSLFLTACGKKTTTAKPTLKTNVQSTKTIELSPQDRPYISLTPRADGHLLTLKIDNIPSSVTQLDYELIYTVHDPATNQDIEKGVGDTVKEVSKSISKDLLLGTESCTNGCKYSYDNGVNGGTLTLTLMTAEGQAVFESPFVFKSSADIKKENGISLPAENITVSATTTTKSDFFVMLKNYGLPKGITAKTAYSIFSNGTGAGKISSISPNTVTKSSITSIVGDYLAQ